MNKKPKLTTTKVLISKIEELAQDIKEIKQILQERPRCQDCKEFLCVCDDIERDPYDPDIHDISEDDEKDFDI